MAVTPDEIPDSVLDVLFAGLPDVDAIQRSTWRPEAWREALAAAITAWEAHKGTAEA
jgi:hypothetical protein